MELVERFTGNFNKDELNNDRFTDILEKGTKGTIISVFGKLIKSLKGQDYELIADNKGVDYFDCICELNEYPISKNTIRNIKKSFTFTYEN